MRKNGQKPRASTHVSASASFLGVGPFLSNPLRYARDMMNIIHQPLQWISGRSISIGSRSLTT